MNMTQFLADVVAREKQRHAETPRHVLAPAARRLTPDALAIARASVLHPSNAARFPHPWIDDIWIENILTRLDATDWVALSWALGRRPPHRLRRLATATRLAETYPQFTPRWDWVFMFHQDALARARQESRAPTTPHLDQRACLDLLTKDATVNDNNNNNDDDEDDMLEEPISSVDGSYVVYPNEATTYTDKTLRALVPSTSPRFCSHPHAATDNHDDDDDDNIMIIDESNTTEMWNVVYICLQNAMPLGNITTVLSTASAFFGHLRRYKGPSTSFLGLGHVMPPTSAWPSRDISHSPTFMVAVQLVARIMACDDDVFGDWEAWCAAWLDEPARMFAPARMRLVSPDMTRPVDASEIGLLDEHVEHARELALRLSRHVQLFDEQRHTWRPSERALFLNRTGSRWQWALNLWLDEEGCYDAVGRSPSILQAYMSSEHMTPHSYPLTLRLDTGMVKVRSRKSCVGTFIDAADRTAFGSRRHCGTGMCHMQLGIPLIANHRTLGGEQSDIVTVNSVTDLFDPRHYYVRNLGIASRRRAVYLIECYLPFMSYGTVIASHVVATGHTQFFSLNGQIESDAQSLLSLTALGTRATSPPAKRRRLDDDGAYAVV